MQSGAAPDHHPNVTLRVVAPFRPIQLLRNGRTSLGLPQGLVVRSGLCVAWSNEAQSLYPREGVQAVCAIAAYFTEHA